MSRLSASRVALVALACFVALLGLSATPAAAHSGKQAYLYVSLFEDGVEGRVEIPVVDLGPAIGVDLLGDPAGLDAAVAASADEITAYVAEHTALSDSNGPWSLSFGELSVLPTSKGAYAVVSFVVDNEFDAAPESFTAEFAVIIESNPEKDALLHIEDDWRSATFNNGSTPLLGFSTGLTVQEVVLEDAGALSSLSSIRGLGSDGVRNGVDVFLVAAALTMGIVLLPAGRSRRDIALPGEVAGRFVRLGGLFVLFVLIGSFATGLVVDLPFRAVGLAVAVSMGALAVWAVAGRFSPPLRAAGPWLAAFGGVSVGLDLGQVFVIHDLDRTRPLLSWTGFVIGAVVALALVAVFVGLPLYLLRRTRVADVVLIGLAVILVAYAVSWSGENLVDADWPIEEFSNPLRVWPRNGWFVLLAVALAAGMRAIESARGGLRPVGPAQNAQAAEPADEPMVVGR